MEEEDMWHSYACSLPHKHQQSRDADAQIASLLALGEDTRCGGSRGERKVSQHLSRAPSLEEDEEKKKATNESFYVEHQEQEVHH